MRYAHPALVCGLLLAGCTRQLDAPEFAMAKETAYTFSDSTSVDLWRLDYWEDYAVPRTGRTCCG